MGLRFLLLLSLGTTVQAFAPIGTFSRAFDILSELFTTSESLVATPNVAAESWCDESAHIEDAVDYQGADLLKGGVKGGTTSPKACCLECFEHPKCVAWTWGKDSHKCWLKTSDSGREKQSNRDSGPISRTATPAATAPKEHDAPLAIGTQHAALPPFAETPAGAKDVNELETDEDAMVDEEHIIASTPAGPALEAAEKKEEEDEGKEKDDEETAEHDFAASPEGETPAAKAEESAVVSDEHKEDAEVKAEETETKTEDKPGLAPAAEAADENKDKEEEEEGAVEEDKTLDAEEKAFGKTAAEEKEEQEAAKEEKTPETPAQEEAEHKGEDEYVKKGPCTAIAQVSGSPKSGSWKVTDEKSLATREQVAPLVTS